MRVKQKKKERRKKKTTREKENYHVFASLILLWIILILFSLTCGASPIVAGVKPVRSFSLYPPNEAKCSNNSLFCWSNCWVLACTKFENKIIFKNSLVIIELNGISCTICWMRNRFIWRSNIHSFSAFVVVRYSQYYCDMRSGANKTISRKSHGHINSSGLFVSFYKCTQIPV